MQYSVGPCLGPYGAPPGGWAVSYGEVPLYLLRQGVATHGRQLQGTSLIRNRAPVGPHSRTMPRSLLTPWGGVDVSYKRDTPVERVLHPLASGRSETMPKVGEQRQRAQRRSPHTAGYQRISGPTRPDFCNLTWSPRP